MPLSTESVAAASLMTCRNMSKLSVVGRVLEQNLERHHVHTKENRVRFHWEEFQAFLTFYLTCGCGWKAPIKVMDDAFNAFFLHNLWDVQIEASLAV